MATTAENGGLSMVDQSTNIDILSLEDFRKTLDNRLKEANGLLAHLRDQVPASLPLGGFYDAGTTSGQHATRHATQVANVRRLISAIEAAQRATDTIITNYTSTEARNNANSKDIENVLGGVAAALNGGNDG
ncbi:hypothetical protein Val02_65690 [Virgisporangium aliadipatigenens]|uniref:Uncharacterized protein n=1 Tax=Virgisporangium aliadipatigenens TaxID=741659 RepID=A0A8J3YSM4_9ACTN|nr:hypothetical protein [Virgisporangium aliadipatigenens]GIJ49683.1 hypothetical protein Val02_65690 [Virgisporangium aliadipatigenens]